MGVLAPPGTPLLGHPAALQPAPQPRRLRARPLTQLPSRCSVPGMWLRAAGGDCNLLDWTAGESLIPDGCPNITLQLGFIPNAEGLALAKCCPCS